MPDGRSLVTGDPLPSYNELLAQVRAAWDGAAQAVRIRCGAISPRGSSQRLNVDDAELDGVLRVFGKVELLPTVNDLLKHPERSLFLKSAAKRRIDLDGNVIESCHRDFDCALDRARVQSFSPAEASIRTPG